ncbi:hypothetical protein BXZ70DRAFT_911697 [Cristinia sonorae]|uniref:Uncharacterized protein n=1 Tax=Cristinia sonorae TaxID=1940300 RepID=A0A8K0UER9_9AGAR|nr:hypothetical protein BXZ70DRAFT_911697 [Cristinia sonorae]
MIFGTITSVLNLFVVEGSAHQAILGRPWQHDHFVAIGRNPEGTYVKIHDIAHSRTYELVLQDPDQLAASIADIQGPSINATTTGSFQEPDYSSLTFLHETGMSEGTESDSSSHSNRSGPEPLLNGTSEESGSGPGSSQRVHITYRPTRNGFRNEFLAMNSTCPEPAIARPGIVDFFTGQTPVGWQTEPYWRPREEDTSPATTEAGNPEEADLPNIGAPHPDLVELYKWIHSRDPLLTGPPMDLLEPHRLLSAPLQGESDSIPVEVRQLAISRPDVTEYFTGESLRTRNLVMEFTGVLNNALFRGRAFLDVSRTMSGIHPAAIGSHTYPIISAGRPTPTPVNGVNNAFRLRVQRVWEQIAEFEEDITKLELELDQRMLEIRDTRHKFQEFLLDLAKDALTTLQS